MFCKILACHISLCGAERTLSFELVLYTSVELDAELEELLSSELVKLGSTDELLSKAAVVESSTEEVATVGFTVARAEVGVAFFLPPKTLLFVLLRGPSSSPA